MYVLSSYCYSPSTQTFATAEAGFTEVQSHCVYLQQYPSTVRERYNDAEVRTHHKRDLALAFMKAYDLLLPHPLMSYYEKTLVVTIIAVSLYVSRKSSFYHKCIFIIENFTTQASAL